MCLETSNKICVCDRQKNAPSPTPLQATIHFPTPGTREYVTRPRGIKVGDEIKVANQMTLNWEVISDYLGKSSVIAGLL